MDADSADSLINMNDLELPPEIAMLICHEIDRADVPRLRLVSRFWNDAASPYLRHKPRLVFKQDSFNRLLDLSKHPFFSKFVKSLVYEPNTLKKPDRGTWERDNPLLPDTDGLPYLPRPDATKRDMREYQKPLSKERMDEAWSMYEKFYQEQANLREREYGFGELREAISNFPNLRKVSMSFGYALGFEEGYTTDDNTNPYLPALPAARADEWYPDPCGVPQMRSLVLAIHEANIQLKSLRIGEVNWRFLALDSTIIDKMKEVLAPLEQFELHISTGYGEEDDEIGIEIPECRDFLHNNSLHNFVSAASRVEDLYIGFDWSEPYSPADFSNIFQSTKWPFLRVLTLESIETSEEIWLSFLKRHASTLRELTLCSIELSSGAWVDVLERMQQSLSLESALFYYKLTGANPQQLYSLGDRTCAAIEYFFIHGGGCPLRDEKACPNEAGSY